MAVEQGLTREGKQQTMKHIDEFTIHAFRGLRDVKFEGLGQINLLVGDNNSGKTTVLVKHKRLGRAPLSTFGDGLRRVFALAAAVTGVKGGWLLVDELELALHTSLLEITFTWLVKACVQNDVQLFATTHSLESVDAVLSACDDDVDLVTYRMRRSEDRTDVARFNKKALLRLREISGMEVR